MEALININEFKKKNKARFIINLVLISLLLIATIAITIVLLLTSTLNYNLPMIINIVLTVVVALFTIFYFLNIFPLVKHYYFYYRGLNDISLEKRRYMVYFKEVESKEIDKVTYRVLQFIYKEGESEYNENLYVLDNDVSLKEGQAYRLSTYHNVIIKYEEINNASR